MALELEYKFQLPSDDLLTELLNAPEITALLDTPFRELPMETTYFDREDRCLSQHRWTLRHRMEGEESVVCLKTPGSLAHSRNEWQVNAPCMSADAIRELIRQGAPEELLSYYEESPPLPICGAKFLRRCAMLTFSDGSRAELALDQGHVFGSKGNLPILELELELYQGEATEMTRFAALIARIYGLKEQPYSKFARASSLR